jgi:hypothetical protein
MAERASVGTMERSIPSGCGRILRVFWETICPYDIYWGTEVKETNTRYIEWLKLSQKKDTDQATPTHSQKRPLPPNGKSGIPLTWGISNPDQASTLESTDDSMNRESAA